MTLWRTLSHEAAHKLIYCCGAVVLCALVTFATRDTWVLLVVLPLLQVHPEASLTLTALDDAVSIAAGVTLYATWHFVAPLLAYEALTFWQPALFRHEARRLQLFLGSWLALTALGHATAFLPVLRAFAAFSLSFQCAVGGEALALVQPQLAAYLRFAGTWALLGEVLLLLAWGSALCWPSAWGTLWREHKGLGLAAAGLGLALLLPPDLQALASLWTLVLLEGLGFALCLRLGYEAATGPDAP